MKINYIVGNVSKYKNRRKELNIVFSSFSKRLFKEVISPCNNYRLVIWEYCDTSKEKKYWSLTEGVLFKGDTELISIKRNYSNFYYHFYNNYLIVGEDYQGYSIIDLDKLECTVYFPKEAYKGGGFCWSSVLGVVNNKLVFVGCYWGAPYDVVIYEFNSENLIIPLKELQTIELESGEEAVIINNKLLVKKEVEFRLSDGKLYDDLTDDEQDELDNYSYLSSYKVITTNTIEL